MPRLQSDVSAGKAGKKGAAVQAAGDKAGSPSSKPTKGNSAGTGVRGAGNPGAPVALDIAPAVGSAADPTAILLGHNEVPFDQVHGPVRPWAHAEHPGGAKKTPSAREMVRKGME
jgi:hypothetical protein